MKINKFYKMLKKIQAEKKKNHLVLCNFIPAHISIHWTILIQ